MSEVETVQASPQPIEPSKRKKGKRKYSKRRKSAQVAVLGSSKAARRLSRGIHKGVRRWTRELDKSSRRKKDGIIKDAPRNLRKAVGAATGDISRAPVEFLRVFEREVSMKKLRKMKWTRLF